MADIAAAGSGSGVSSATATAVVTIADPRSISGLVAWYSAEAETGYADNASMATWTDLSGNANHAPAVGTGPLWRSTAGPSSGPAIQWNGSTGQELLPPNVMGSATSGEVMVQIKGPASGDTGLWSFGAVSASNESHYPFGGIVYESFGLASGQRQSFTPSLAITSWRRYNVWSAASDWAASLDGTSQATYASATVAWDTTPRIGQGENGAGDLRFTGHMSCLVLYSRKLTTGERSDLATWFAVNPSGGTLPPSSSGGSGVSSATAEASQAGTVSATGAGSGQSAASGLATVTPRLLTTDKFNRSNGRCRSGTGYANQTEPLTAAPATITRQPIRVMAQTLPLPVLVDGTPQ